MRITVLPKTSLGWWSVGLVIACFVFGFVSMDIISPTEPSKYPTVLTVTFDIILEVMAGAAFVTGLISIIKRKQGAILIFVSTALGLWIFIANLIGWMNL